MSVQTVSVRADERTNAKTQPHCTSYTVIYTLSWNSFIVYPDTHMDFWWNFHVEGIQMKCLNRLQLALRELCAALDACDWCAD